MAKFLILILIWSASVFAGQREVTLTPRNTVILSGMVTPILLAQLSHELYTKYERQDSDEKLYLVIYMPGGMIEGTLEFIAVARTLPALEIVVVRAYSAGALIAQLAAATRLICINGELLFHQSRVVYDVPLTAQELQELLKEFKQRSDAFDKMCHSRMALTTEQYLEKVSGKDWILKPGEALRVGAADEEVRVTCDPELEKKSPLVPSLEPGENAKLSPFCQVLKKIQTQPRK